MDRRSGRERTPKFFCRACGHDTVSRVLETRGVRRRRVCVDCGETFPTLEVLAPRRAEPRHRAIIHEPALPFDS